MKFRFTAQPQTILGELKILLIALLLVLTVPLVFIIWLIFPSEGACDAHPIFSEAAPDGKKAVVIEEKECDLGLGLNDRFIDIVIRPSDPNASEEQIFRTQIPDGRNDLQAHWTGNKLLVIERPKEHLKQEMRTWLPSVKVRLK